MGTAAARRSPVADAVSARPTHCSVSTPNVSVHGCFLPQRPQLKHDLLTQVLLIDHPTRPSPVTLLFLHCSYHPLKVFYCLPVEI